MPPVNDDITNATLLTGISGTSIAGDNTGAGTEDADEDAYWGAGTPTVWWKWQNTLANPVLFTMFDLLSSAFEPEIDAFKTTLASPAAIDLMFVGNTALSIGDETQDPGSGTGSTTVMPGEWIFIAEGNWNFVTTDFGAFTFSFTAVEYGREVHVSDDGFDTMHVYDEVGAGLYDYTDGGGNLTHPIKAGFSPIDQRIWVTNFGVGTGRYPLYLFEADGTEVGALGVDGVGSADGQTQGATGIGVAPDGSVFIGDHVNRRVQKFVSGAYSLKWGSAGSGNGQFGAQPYMYLAVDASGNVYVTDHGNTRVQVFDSSGTFLFKWGTSGTGPGQFTAPRGIAIAPDGTVYVVESTWLPSRQRFQHFQADGTYIDEYDAPADTSADGDFNQPLDIAVDLDGNIYVADSGNNRIQKFDPSYAFVTKWASNFPEGVSVRFGASLSGAVSFWTLRHPRRNNTLSVHT